MRLDTNSTTITLTAPLQVNSTNDDKSSPDDDSSAPFGDETRSYGAGWWRAVILPCYGDESSDETRSRVFAMAAIVAPEEVWREAEDAWVLRTGGKEFHANECESEFAHDPEPQKH